MLSPDATTEAADMKFEITKLNDLSVSKQEIEARAETKDVALSKKERFALAARDVVYDTLARRIEAILAGALDTQEGVFGLPEGRPDAEWLEEWHQLLRESFPAIERPVIESVLFGRELWNEAQINEAAHALTESIMPAFEPDPDHYGRYLSALGIIAKDYAEAGEGAALDMRTGKRAPPTPEELSQAFQTYRQATAVDVKTMAKTIGVAPATWGNYLSGRTNPRGDVKQARAMLADIDDRRSKLLAAAEVFHRVVQ